MQRLMLLSVEYLKVSLPSNLFLDSAIYSVLIYADVFDFRRDFCSKLISSYLSYFLFDYVGLLC